MIDKDLVDFISKKLDISEKGLIEKDLIISQILFYLAQNKEFFQSHAFKGGTCLIKCYLGYYRFSEDLDFTYLNQREFMGKSKKKVRELISKKISRLGETIGEIAGHLDLDFKIEKENKKYIEFGGGNTFVTFKIWYYSGELGKETFVKIQINHIENLNYPIRELNARDLVPKNFEKEFSFLMPEQTEIIFKNTIVRVYDIREILIEKVRAILTRRGTKARDFVDVFLIINKEKLDLNKFRKKIIRKISDMLVFEKYQQNIKYKNIQLDERLILGDEEKLLLVPIDRNFSDFLKKFKVFLKEIINELCD